MTRVAILVDGGYLYAGGAVALAGSLLNRERMTLRQAETIAKLETTAKEITNGGSLLRVYWYDGLVRGRPSPEQQSLAHTDNIKLRLGVVTAGRQKVVDSMIVTDLIELARNYAISDAVLLSGDEDLRIWVQMAQSFGVRVHLIGIEPNRGNQSDLLMQEADTTREWSREDIREILSFKSDIEPEYRSSKSEIAPMTSEDDGDETLGQIVENIVKSMDESERSKVVEGLTQNPRWVPKQYDVMLLSEGAEKLGRELEQEEKHRVRDTFKEVVKSALS